jgi:hypothetical protein
LGVVRLAVTGALAAAIFFILCWIGAAIGLGPATHGYIGLFTDAPMASTTALVIGTCWSFVFGLVAGGLIALLYNLLATLDRR